MVNGWWPDARNWIGKQAKSVGDAVARPFRETGRFFKRLFGGGRDRPHSPEVQMFEVPGNMSASVPTNLSIFGPTGGGGMNTGANGIRGANSTWGFAKSLNTAQAQGKGGITFPSFSTLWNNYPHDIDGEHQHPSSNPAYHNQCAIRMSDCLIKSGISLTGYPKDDLDKDYGKWALTANRLKYYISQNNSNFVKVSQADFESKYWNQTGIIYIAPPPGGVGHIDLFNQGKTGSGYYLGSQIWFWPIK